MSKISNNARQGVQGLQAFSFGAVTVNDEHTKPTFVILLSQDGF